MPLDQIRTVLAAPDVGTRNSEIATRLERMERQLQQTQASVAGLRALLAGPAAQPAFQLRSIPEVTALAVRDVVSAADAQARGGQVAERAIGVEGPIREYYLVGFAHTDDEREHRTEVCWPVFRTAAAG